jgi:hypothetical protein
MLGRVSRPFQVASKDVFIRDSLICLYFRFSSSDPLIREGGLSTAIAYLGGRVMVLIELPAD